MQISAASLLIPRQGGGSGMFSLLKFGKQKIPSRECITFGGVGRNLQSQAPPETSVS